MDKNKKIILITSTLTLLIVGIFMGVWCATYPFKEPVFEEKEKYYEKDYVKAYCKGEIEYVLPDRTRVDCLTEEYAIEFDRAKNWAQGVGQAQYYAQMTGKKPAIALIMSSPKDKRFIKRIKKANKDIVIFTINARL